MFDFLYEFKQIFEIILKNSIYLLFILKVAVLIHINCYLKKLKEITKENEQEKNINL